MYDLIETNYMKSALISREPEEDTSLSKEMMDTLAHHGILGMKWGIRRFQPYGEGGYNPDNKGKFIGNKSTKKMTNEELAEATKRKQLENEYKAAKRADARAKKQEKKDEKLQKKEEKRLKKAEKLQKKYDKVQEKQIKQEIDYAKVQEKTRQLQIMNNYYRELDTQNSRLAREKEAGQAKWKKLAREYGQKAAITLYGMGMDYAKKQLHEAMYPEPTVTIDGKSMKVSKARKIIDQLNTINNYRRERDNYEKYQRTDKKYDVGNGQKMSYQEMKDVNMAWAQRQQYMKNKAEAESEARKMYEDAAKAYYEDELKRKRKGITG